ncbi:FAD-dependent oxidoreductase [Deinococcus cellulosilyticus]|uniref:Flavin-dependent monooxygenase n=1 Tax=Deinococcus cellulosilyticus (strain DSM 18568 / NBRC 106333 / KACC 11606 / 5516J-15) TaxID=1223518 RepID=A0A511MYF0_DEIC1|nr:NAD(P)/FAD-dependent oxidoreductase [Deinococcus cellulosilyticus]GEM45612.1 FAD-dependent oxidoreductase [Deinococcus cellulosilyticus NBRC 106333 = KACC 11606]
MSQPLNPHTPPTPRIAIIGAGPGGLLCARVLQQRGIPVTVYEGDLSATSRNQGGTLDMHADQGQIALEDAGLLAAFMQLARPESQAKKRLDSQGNVLSQFVPQRSDTAAPEIDRGQLRTLLTDHLAPGIVQWNHKLLHVTPLGGGTHRLHFEHGSTADVDLLIGADGAHSRVRPLLTDQVPQYSGVTFLEVQFDDVDRRHPDIARLVGEGDMFATDGQRLGIIGQRNSHCHVRVYIGMKTPLDWHTQAGLNLKDPDQVRQHLLDTFTGWSEDLLAVIRHNEGVFVVRPLFALPAPMRWAHVPGVTLLGDAAHLMAPFGGFGANLALLEGAELARCIAEHPSPDQAIRQYERVMFERSGPLAVAANEGLAGFFGVQEGPLDVPDHHAEHQQYQEAAALYRQRQRDSGMPQGLGVEGS